MRSTFFKEGKFNFFRLNLDNDYWNHFLYVMYNIQSCRLFPISIPIFTNIFRSLTLLILYSLFQLLILLLSTLILFYLRRYFFVYLFQFLIIYPSLSLTYPLSIFLHLLFNILDTDRARCSAPHFEAGAAATFYLIKTGTPCMLAHWDTFLKPQRTVISYLIVDRNYMNGVSGLGESRPITGRIKSQQ